MKFCYFGIVIYFVFLHSLIFLSSKNLYPCTWRNLLISWCSCFYFWRFSSLGITKTQERYYFPIVVHIQLSPICLYLFCFIFIFVVGIFGYIYHCPKFWETFKVKYKPIWDCNLLADFHSALFSVDTKMKKEDNRYLKTTFQLEMVLRLLFFPPSTSVLFSNQMEHLEIF